MEASYVIFQAPATAGDECRQVDYLIIPDSDGGDVVQPVKEVRCSNEAEAIRILSGMHPGLGMRTRKLIGADPIGTSDIT